MAKRKRNTKGQHPLSDLFSTQVPTKPRTKTRRRIVVEEWGSSLLKNNLPTRTTIVTPLYDIPGPIPDIDALNNDQSLLRDIFKDIPDDLYE